jgi:hypothetical protein
MLAAGCSAATEPTPTLVPTESPASAQAGGLPPGCATIELRAPSGERIELDGTWVEVGSVGELMTWWIRTQGNCVWGAGSIDEPAPAGPFPRPDSVQSLSGVLGPDFVITGEIVWLGAPGAPPPYSPLRMFVEFDDAGEILLREDREPGTTGPRCPDPAGFCPAPLVLQRVE